MFYIKFDKCLSIYFFKQNFCPSYCLFYDIYQSIHWIVSYRPLFISLSFSFFLPFSLSFFHSFCFSFFPFLFVHPLDLSSCICTLIPNQIKLIPCSNFFYFNCYIFNFRIFILFFYLIILISLLIFSLQSNIILSSSF